jgi:insulysin
MGGFMKHGVPVDQAALGAMMASGPDLQKVKDFALAAVKTASGLAESAVGELQAMIGGLQGKEATASDRNDEEGEGGEKLVEGTVWIKSQEELLRFKAGLKGSSVPVPVEPIDVGSAKL